MYIVEKVICPLCNDAVDKLLSRFHIDSEQAVLNKIKDNNPGWAEADGCCSRCVDYYQIQVIQEQRILPELGPYFPVKSVDDFIILPTTLRVDANPKFTGKGVTICFIDSGFYIHPDLSKNSNRIKAVVDIAYPGNAETYFKTAHPESWHGTMTTVVCAGDGLLSNGLYKGIASEAALVLLKVQDNEGKISTSAIVKALKWVIKNHKEYNIRVLNMSLGDDTEGSWKNSEVDQLAEQLIKEGVTIVAAVGNSETASVRPPANAPNVVTIGGLDDNNRLGDEKQLYHSAYGKTGDGLTKPELIANAIWLAAPILPGTPEQREAKALYTLVNTDDNMLHENLKELYPETKLEEAVLQIADIKIIREAVTKRISQCKYISEHYMHVDGTSFAAPIVTAVIAQLLEADPALTPREIRSLLFSTAQRLPGMPAERQGFGIINPRKALIKIIQNQTIMIPHSSPVIDTRRKTIEFYVQNTCATQISLAGSFNHWAQDVLLMEPGKEGSWKIEIPLLPYGKYEYKFFVDHKMWIEDIGNPYREPDGFNGFNSLLLIEN